MATREQYQARFDALDDARHAFHTLHTGIANMDKWFVDLLDTEDDSQIEPALAALEAKDSELASAKAAIAYKEKRKEEYLKRGLTFDKFVEAIIEDDNQAMADFRQQRQQVKQMFPKGGA